MRRSQSSRRSARRAPALMLSLLAAAAAVPEPAGRAQPAGGVDRARLARIDDAVGAAIAAGDLPGAVVLVSHRGETVYRKAFGRRAVVPQPEPMTVDTIFDLASLTKVVATATAVMMLAEEGRIRLRAPAARYLPGFERHGKQNVTVEQLLTHVSGLRAGFDLAQQFTGCEAALERAFDERPVAPPGARFLYSDVNFVLLGEVVARAAGMPLERFAARRIFAPLGMRDTMFLPPARLRPRIAPTAACAGLEWPCAGAGSAMLRGVVHDPTARRMGGAAGHAGLFGTASDLARFGALLLAGGALDGVRILAPATVARMTSPATPAGLRDRRGLGWDIDSRYSGSRGGLFPIGSFGHTGFTGTSLWIDPASETVVVLLSSRLHPAGGGDVRALRAQVATLAAAAVGARPPARTQRRGPAL